VSYRLWPLLMRGFAHWFDFRAVLLLGLLWTYLFPQESRCATDSLNQQGAPDAGVSWNMRETAPDAAGRLTFYGKPWWPRARDLAEGQSFSLDLNGDGRPDTVIQRLNGDIIEAIDDTGRASNILNQVNTAYLVSYKGSGIVDRMVAYIDNDADGKCDEMEVRYYQDGYLRYGWFGENYDNDGAQIFPLNRWQYSGNGFNGKFRGNVLMYLNKYDPVTKSWVPLAECPFAFFDPNQDGIAEIVVRVSAVPKVAIDGEDLDYANNPDYRWAPNSPRADDIAMANFRLSYRLDSEARHDGPHLTFGFTMVGDLPYQVPQRFYTNPRRRPPQTLVRLPWDSALDTALRYPARETGFTWDELGDQNRWEGQFWIWERRLLENTGEPLHRWNMRREYLPYSSTSRQLYYSGVDRRYHLLGATEGWLEVGQLVDVQKDLEIRFYDSAGTGYFDTWEVFLGHNPVPVRTTRVLDAKVRPVTLDREFLAADYNRRILPLAIVDDEQLITVMKQFVTYPLARQYEEKAAASKSAEAKRYLLDVARELYFLKLRDALYARNSEEFYPRRTEIIHPWNIRDEKLPMRTIFWNSLRSFGHFGTLAHSGYGFLRGYTIGDSLEFQRLATQIHVLVNDYGEGNFAAAAKDLNAMDPRVLRPDTGTMVLRWLAWSAELSLTAGIVVFLIWRVRRSKGVSGL
jgi:hypothetical protein